jgi:hypothetical protein
LDLIYIFANGEKERRDKMPKGVYVRTEEIRKKNSVAQKKRWERPEEHRKMSEGIKTAMNRPEIKQKQSIAKKGENNGQYKHGLRKHSHYIRWKSMKQRCYSPKCKSYKNYGQRGIIVCEEWRTDPVAFCEWADEHYSPGLEIDRKDNDGNYSPENCRFVTRKVNCNNRRNKKK